MRVVVYVPATGRILYQIEGSSEQVAAQAVEGERAVLEGEGRSEADWVSDGAILARPTTGLPPSITLRPGEVWRVPEMPSGAVIVVDGAEAGTVEEEGLTMRFDVAGDYAIEAHSPFPWLNGACAVSVTS